MGKAYGDAFRAKMVCFLLGVLFFCVSPVWAGGDQRVTTIHAVGSSKIRGADMSASRNEAIAASLVAAVTKVVTEIMPPDTVVGHFQVINERVFAKTDQFILDYKMLTESTHARQHRVMVRARVSVQRIKDTLKKSGIYVGKRTYPSVLICIAEKQINDVNYQYWWGGQQFWRAGVATETVTHISKEKGLVTINPRIDPSRKAYSPQLSVPEAVALGREMQADVVVVGQAFTEEAANTMESTLQSFRGNILARAYRVLNGNEIGQVNQVSMSTAADPLTGTKDALEKASALAGEQLAAQIVNAWFSEGAGSSKVELLVEGLSGNIANFVKFRGALSTMSGVDSVQRKEMQLDTAVLLVDYQGNVGALADALMRQNYDTFSLNILEPEGNTIRIKLVAR
ncbi:MAG: hypothetical protein PVH87_20755 [Desulfobacteraceae bacterium]|jgi:hypothetical protein